MPSPIPRPSKSDERFLRIIEIVSVLAATDDRFSNWLNMIGGSKRGALTEDERDSFLCELDALVAHLYELSRQQLVFIFSNFHRGWDYETRLNLTLTFFDKIKGKSNE